MDHSIRKNDNNSRHHHRGPDLLRKATEEACVGKKPGEVRGRALAGGEVRGRALAGGEDHLRHQTRSARNITQDSPASQDPDRTRNSSSGTAGKCRRWGRGGSSAG